MGKRRSHPGNIERISRSSWRVRLSVEGVRHRFTVRGSRKVAEALARKKYDELLRRADMGLPGEEPISSLLRRFEEVRVPQRAPLTQKTYRASLAAFRTYFCDRSGDPLANKVRPGHVQAFLHWRRSHNVDGSKRNGPLSARSLAKDRATLHAVFAFGETLELVESNPVRRVPAPKGDAKEPVILTADEYESLLESCGDRPMLRTWVLVLGEAGLRSSSEALWLRWEDIDLARGFLRVESVRKGRRTKSGKSRMVPLTGRLRAALQEHAAAFRLRTYPNSRSPWVFHHEVTRRHARAGDRLADLRRAFRAAAARAGLSPDFTPHHLRHRRVTTWLAAGQPPHLVQKAMGHADIRTTLAYTHLVPDDLLLLVERNPVTHALG